MRAAIYPGRSGGTGVAEALAEEIRAMHPMLTVNIQVAEEPGDTHSRSILGFRHLDDRCRADSSRKSVKFTNI